MDRGSVVGAEQFSIRLSGGTTNVDVDASTGGAISTTVVLSQAATIATAVRGITTYNAAGNAVGSGVLKYFFATKTVTWAPPGKLAGTVVNIAVSGTYEVRGGLATDGYIVINVIASQLPLTADYTTAVVITNKADSFLSAVTKDNAAAGVTDYHLFYLINSGSTIAGARIEISVETPGADTLSLCTLPSRNTSDTLVNAPGYTYYALGAGATVGELRAGDYIGFWIKRVTPAASPAIIANTFRILITSYS